jgi:urease accessory protein
VAGGRLEVAGRSSAKLRLEPGEVGPTVERLRCSGAMSFRSTDWGVWMVGTEAHPIGGDRLLVQLALGAECSAEIRSTSATVARRGPRDSSGQSSAVTVILMGVGSSLDWFPEPGIAASGALHLSDTRITMREGSRLRWQEGFVVGRHGEEPGTWRSRLRVTVGNRPVLASENSAGPLAPGWLNRSVLGGARAVSTLVLIGPGCYPSASARTSAGSAQAVALPLGGGHGIQITAWGDDLGDCRDAIGSLSSPRRRSGGTTTATG